MSNYIDPVTVRVADHSDLPALAELRSNWNGEGATEPGFALRLSAWFEQERDRRTTWLAHAEERPLGMVSLVEFRRMPTPCEPDTQWGYIGQMFVREEIRNRGVGLKLLRALIAAADQRGYVRLVLSPSSRAVPFFQRAGFEVADGKSTTMLCVRRGPAG